MGKALLAGWQQDSQLDATLRVDPALNSPSHHSATRHLHQLSNWKPVVILNLLS